MMTDLEIAGIIAAGSMAPGTGRTIEQRDGTWVAVACLDRDDLGVYGAGATEGHALKALDAKLKALGSLSGSAYAEAESRYQVRTRAEAKEMSDKLTRLFGGDAPPPAKKPEEN